MTQADARNFSFSNKFIHGAGADEIQPLSQLLLVEERLADRRVGCLQASTLRESMTRLFWQRGRPKWPNAAPVLAVEYPLQAELAPTAV